MEQLKSGEATEVARYRLYTNGHLISNSVMVI